MKAVVFDPVELELFRRAMEAIAEEMGAALQRSAFSPNIKERLDFSCALFDSEGRLLAQAAHIPVHLGSMPDAVAAARAGFPSLAPGDVVVLNDPYRGGNHLPDVTMVTPVFRSGRRRPRLIGFVANRAHHADVGGMVPGSMPVATEIFQEGLRIPPLKLWEGGRRNEAAWSLILANVRTPEERRGDLLAQRAANHVGAVRLQEWIDAHGLLAFRRRATALLAYGEAALAYAGDGATSTGAFHEGFNLAAVQRLPLVVIVENNGYAYSTPVARPLRTTTRDTKVSGRSTSRPVRRARCRSATGSPMAWTGQPK